MMMIPSSSSLNDFEFVHADSLVNNGYTYIYVVEVNGEVTVAEFGDIFKLVICCNLCVYHMFINILTINQIRKLSVIYDDMGIYFVPQLLGRVFGPTAFLHFLSLSIYFFFCSCLIL